MFCTFSLQNVLLATAACNFWFLLWPHDSAPAALTSLLFDSPDTRIIGKTQRFATSLTFGAGESSFFWLSRYCIFFLLTLLHLLTLLSCDFTSSICFSSAFQLSILSEVYYLNFLRLMNTRSNSNRRNCLLLWVVIKTCPNKCVQYLLFETPYPHLPRFYGFFTVSPLQEPRRKDTRLDLQRVECRINFHSSSLFQIEDIVLNVRKTHNFKQKTSIQIEDIVWNYMWPCWYTSNIWLPWPQILQEFFYLKWFGEGFPP